MPDLIQLGTEAVVSGCVLKKYKDSVLVRSMRKTESDGAGRERPKPRDKAEDSDDNQFGEEATECDVDALEGDMPEVN